MFIVLYATPDGVKFYSAHETREEAIESLRDTIDNNPDTECWGWVQQVEYFEDGCK